MQINGHSCGFHFSQCVKVDLNIFWYTLHLTPSPSCLQTCQNTTSWEPLLWRDLWRSATILDQINVSRPFSYSNTRLKNESLEFTEFKKSINKSIPCKMFTSVRASEGLQDVQSVCAHYLCGIVPVSEPSVPMSSSTTLAYPSFSMQSDRTWSTRCSLRSMASRWGLMRMGESVSVWRLSSIRALSLYSCLTNSWSRKWVDFFILRQAVRINTYAFNKFNLWNNTEKY